MDLLRILLGHLLRFSQGDAQPLQKRGLQRCPLYKQIFQPDYHTLNLDRCLRKLEAKFFIFKFFYGGDSFSVLDCCQIPPTRQRLQILLTLLHGIARKVRILRQFFVDLFLIHPVFQFLIILIEQTGNRTISVCVFHIQIFGLPHRFD